MWLRYRKISWAEAPAAGFAQRRRQTKDPDARLKTGLSPAEALRDAKLRMLRGRERLWQDPHFWSAFVACVE